MAGQRGRGALPESDVDDDSGGGDATRAGVVYRALVKAVLSRDLVPGMKLSETDIGEAFNVSRTVVRAALNRLHSESLIEFRKNRGAFVASPSITEARQIFDLRRLLERTVVSRLARSITASQISQLEAMAASHLEQHRLGADADAMHSAEDFHLTLASMLGHGVILTTLSRLIVRSALILALYNRHNVSECGIDEHRNIIAALRARDAEAAATIMDRHLDDVVRRARFSGEDRAVDSLGSILGRHVSARKRANP